MSTEDKGVSAENALAPVSQEEMCILSKTKLQYVLDWLNSDHMTMPQNEARRCIKLLMAAKLVAIKEPPKT